MSGVRHRFLTYSQERLMKSPPSVLVGVTKTAQSLLSDLGIVTLFDLASSSLFNAASRASFPEGTEASLKRYELVPNDLIDEGEIVEDLGALPIARLKMLTGPMAIRLSEVLGVESVRDLAKWPPYLEARQQAGYGTPDELDPFDDPSVPRELVPRFDDHASEKVFYSVYTSEAPKDVQASLAGAVPLEDLADQPEGGGAVKGHVLRYEQSWTPKALTLGNLLHSLTLAPGEATRVAVIDWTRKQGISTQENLSQSERLTNSQVNARSLSEITRAVAREAQSGFSSMDANSTVSNNSYTSYGLTNPGEALAAGAVGAFAGANALAPAGAVAGAGIGAAGGGLIGTGIGLAGMGVTVAAGLPLGLIIGGVAGTAVGGASGALIGGAAGGATGFMGVANFGADLSSETTTQLDSVTTTFSEGTRDIESEMMQTVHDRTQQHASSARNRTASIVQEVSQSEAETVSTRVVANYNHMYALTVQYYEVVQVYSQVTRLAAKKPCLYVPVRSVLRWTPELVRRFRSTILANALTPDLVFGILSSDGTVGLHSPTFGNIPAEDLGELDASTIEKARKILDVYVGGNPFNDWRIPDDAVLDTIWGTQANGGGPFGAADAQIDYTLTIVKRDKSRHEVNPMNLGIPIRDIIAIEYEVRSKARTPSLLERWASGRNADEKVKSGSMRLSFVMPDQAGTFDFNANYAYTKQDIDRTGRRFKLKILDVAKAWAMARVLQHLDENTDWYSRQILRRRDPEMIRTLVENYKYGNGVLAQHVDPDPIAINGMNLVFLLHEPRRDRGRLPEIESEELVPIGTGGVFAEAVRGRANAAERLDLTRFWDWQDSPIPLVPPDIAPIATGSRAQSADVRPGDFDPALVRQQDAAAFPMAQGTSAVLGALQTRLFEDMSGIMQTAQVAQTALQEAARAATASGETVSDSLQKGMEQTTRIIEKAAEMTGDYGKLLAEEGFGLIDKGISAAFGSGGLSGMGGSASSGASTGGGSAASAGLGVARSVAAGRGATPAAAGALNVGNSSKTGALLNRAGDIARSVGGATGVGASPGARTSVRNGDLEGEIIRSIGGIGSGPVETSGWLVPQTIDLGSPESRKAYLGNQSEAALAPLLDKAFHSDADFDAAFRATVELMESAAVMGEPFDAIAAKAQPALVEGFNASFLRSIEAFNGGDLKSVGRIVELIGLAQQGVVLPPEMVEGLDLASMLNYELRISDIVAPTEIHGGEEVMIQLRVTEVLPDGTERPAVGATVSAAGNPVVEGSVTAYTGQDGIAKIVLNHGVPPSAFAGVHRFSGWYDLDLALSATSTVVPIMPATANLIIPGKIKVNLVAAVDLDTGDSVLIGATVAVQRDKAVALEFRATIAGQALQNHRLSEADVTVTGGGTIMGVTNIGLDGSFGVEYQAVGVSGEIVYVSPVVKIADGQEQAGFAPLQILG